ncbi:MAG: hypothetical protein MUC88_05745 [Planctomycetes bacterium]|nr:hypothetical protein [Planctomycetota bacterium]
MLNRSGHRIASRPAAAGLGKRVRDELLCLAFGLIALSVCDGISPQAGHVVLGSPDQDAAGRGWGPTVTVQGRERPLVRQQGIQGELEAGVEHRADEQTTGASSRQSTTNVFEERVRLKTNGDVYHPDLLGFQLMVGTGLTQQNLDSDDWSGWSTGTLNEYNASAEILRSKPYSALFNANRSEDLIARRFLSPLEADSQSESVSVFLRPESWPMMLQYSSSDTRQDSLSALAPDYFARMDERFRYSLGHDFSALSHLHFDFDWTDTHQESLGAEVNTVTTTYTLTHDYTFGADERHRLDTLFNYLDQGGSFEFQSLRTQERLKLQHAPSLLSRYEVQYTQLERETLTSDQIRGQAGLEHKLFDSLVTNVDGFASQTDLGDQGDLSQYGGILGLGYTKKNPLGVLLGTYSANYTHSDQQGGIGRGVVVGEAHTANGVLPIELDRTDIDVTTIRVRTAAGALFQPGDDYTVFERDGRIFLNTLVVGGAVPPNFAEGQEFFVDYEFFLEPQRQEDTLRQSATIRERFSNGFSLFYAYRTQQEDVTSTAAQVIPDEYTVNTFGADYTHKGLFLLAEYSVEDSTLIPMESTKLQGRYRWALGPATSVGFGVMNQWLDFGEPDAREVTLFESTVDLFTRLTETYSLSASADYRDEKDTRFGITRGYQFKTELGYQLRQFSATLGAELDLLERREDEINSIFVYFRATRRF